MTVARNTWPCAWLLLAGMAAAVPAAAERQPYDRYQSIVDRQMFGPLPPNFDPTKSPAEVSKSAGSAAEKELSKEQEKVKSSIHFSVINVTPDGETAIGFTDKSDPKAPKHYYLKVGESRDGWEVKEADAKAATMTIAKDGVEVSLSLGGDSSKAVAAAAGGKDASAPAAGAHAPRSSLLGTLGGRRRAKMEREEAAAREAAKVAADREAEMKAREEERARRDEEKEAQRAAEREESRRQLLQIQEELRKAREARQSGNKESGGDGEAQAESE